MSLSQSQLKHRCLYGHGASQCRYLKQGYPHCECLKLLAATKQRIDKEVKELVADAKKQHKDPWAGWVPINDGGNCPGYLYLRTVVQGYDQNKKN